MYSWTGSNALSELQEANISLQCFPILLECATKVSHLYLDSFLFLSVTHQVGFLLKAIKVASDLESEVPHLSGMSVITLEGGELWLYMVLFFTEHYIINDVVWKFCFRFILLTNLFLLKKWFSYAGLPACSAAKC